MTSMRGDIVNRVKRLPKPSSSTEALQPLFECISNALHAVEDQFENAANISGDIQVTVKNLEDAAALRIVVADNGVGLDEERFKAFCTTDTGFKLERGGKGVGRLLWLDCFESIKVSSIYFDGDQYMRREFDFLLQDDEQIGDEIAPYQEGDANSRGTYITFSGIREGAYRSKFPVRGATLIKHFGSHFFADFIMGKSPRVTLTIDEDSTVFPAHVQELCIEERGQLEITNEDFGLLTIASFICDKVASSDFDGNHQLHFIANGRTVLTRKIDGLLGIGKFGENKDHVFHGCVAAEFLDQRVNQERTQFNFDEKIVEEITKACATIIRTGTLHEEIERFDHVRLGTLKDFLNSYPSFGFEEPDVLLARTPKNATKPEQFAQALIPTRIRRDNERRRVVQDVIATLTEGNGIPEDVAVEVARVAGEVRAEEQRQLTEYVVRRKIVLDVLEILIRKVREIEGRNDDFHLENTLHTFICPMQVRGDDPSAIESSDHDLWIIDERLAFTRYFASDVPFADIIADVNNRERPDVLIYDKLHGLGLDGEEPLNRVMLVEFKKPGRRTYDERYSPLNQVTRYLHKLKEGEVVGFNGERIRIAPDCIFQCYVIADIVGNLEVQTSAWKTTSNGRGRWQELSGRYRGSIEIIEWKDLVHDARLRNRAFIEAAGVN